MKRRQFSFFWCKLTFQGNPELRHSETCSDNNDDDDDDFLNKTIPDMVACVFNSSIQEEKAGESMWAPGQPGPHRERLFFFFFKKAIKT